MPNKITLTKVLWPFLPLFLISPATFSAEPSSEIPKKREFVINDQINPCNDFHAYVCSKVESSFKLRSDRSSHTFAFDDSDERILEEKKSFFKKIDQKKNLSARAEQLKDYYKACMNEKEAAKEEKQLISALKSEFESIKTIDDYLNLNRDNMTNEKWSFGAYEITPNTDNPLIYDMTFDLGFMFLPEHSYYDNKDLLASYEELIAAFFNEIYPEQSKDDHLKRAQRVVEFEKKFKDTYPTPTVFRQRYTEPRYVSREQFLSSIKSLKWSLFFEKHVPLKTKIRNFMPESFEFVTKELKAENLAVLKDIYLFRSARGYMDDAYPELYKKRMAFSHKYLGSPATRPDRQERCTGAVMGAFGKELDQVMIQELFPQFPEEKMQTVATKIRQSILNGIKNNKWLSEASKNGALDKISKAKLQIVTPKTDKEWDFKPIQKYSSTQPYANGKKLALLSHQRSFERLKNGVNQEAWGMGPLTVNAYYAPDKNKFVMPIGILQFPFFVADGDIVENLGAVGAVVGHELGHAIDDEGSKFDSDGKLKQWMTEADVKKFKEKGSKLVDQFNQIGHNGELTLGENVADLVGLTFAYNAAFPADKEVKIEQQKKFYTAYARLWCGVMLDKTKEMQLKTDPHSLGYARINEQMKHQAGFQKAFSCKPGDKLYTSESDRLTIW